MKKLKNKIINDIYFIKQIFTDNLLKMENIIKLLTCPISLKIFNEPVLASDGYFYEKYFIIQWFEKSSKSPIKGIELPNKNLVVSHTFNSLLDSFITLNPEYLLNQFKLTIPIKYKNIYSDENYYKYCTDEKIYAKFINLNVLHQFIESEIVSIDFIFKVIDLIDDIYYYPHDNDRTILNDFFSHGNFKIIKYIIDKSLKDKSIDLEFVENDNFKWKPICYISSFCCNKSIQYAIDNGMNVDCIMEYNKIPIAKNNIDLILAECLKKNIKINYAKLLTDGIGGYEMIFLFAIFEYCSENIIFQVINNIIDTDNIDILKITNNNKNIFYYYCKNNNISLDFFVKIINIIRNNNIDIDIDINLEDENGLRPIHQLINLNKFDIAKIIIQQNNFNKSTLVDILAKIKSETNFQNFANFLVINFIK